MKKIALTMLRRMECDGYIFPADYYEIPGVKKFTDIEYARAYAAEQLSSYAGETIDLYVNGGLSIELLVVLQEAARLEITLTAFHFDRGTGEYVPQPVNWHPVGEQEETAAPELTLCKGRHPGMPENVVFPPVAQEQIFDYAWQEEQAMSVLKAYAGGSAAVYLSGLTPLYLTVLNVAARLNISITFYHYNFDEENYFPQKMG